jgi:hypothetical protein
MRLPDTAHTSQPWRIHAEAQGFELEDVWQLPTTDLQQAVDTFTRMDPNRSSSTAVRALFALRRKLGELFDLDDRPFTELYRTDDEWAAETVNKTVHGILHLGRTAEGRVQLAVLVKPNGLFGRAYLLAIRPFRHLIVYPILLREAGDA